EAAAKLAFAHDFILEQTDGYNTLLGDKGCTLSGGQQQRLSIARAILRNAPILFLDEATSALDSESERAIQDALTELSKGKTVIAIAHRLSTVLDSDEIVMMKEGEVVDVASHEVLISRCPDYKALYDLQFEGK
ncbi:MAG: ATP-binding cassette domain-containing protein, partial [Verrucomicrobiota bacterium]